MRSWLNDRKVGQFRDAGTDKRKHSVVECEARGKDQHLQKNRFFFFFSSVPLLKDGTIGGGMPVLVNRFLPLPLLGGCCCG